MMSTNQLRAEARRLRLEAELIRADRFGEDLDQVAVRMGFRRVTRYVPVPRTSRKRSPSRRGESR